MHTCCDKRLRCRCPAIGPCKLRRARGWSVATRNRLSTLRPASVEGTHAQFSHLPESRLRCVSDHAATGRWRAGSRRSHAAAAAAARHRRPRAPAAAGLCRRSGGPGRRAQSLQHARRRRAGATRRVAAGGRGAGGRAMRRLWRCAHSRAPGARAAAPYSSCRASAAAIAPPRAAIRASGWARTPPRRLARPPLSDTSHRPSLTRGRSHTRP